jgi:hypothetical protein
VTLIPDPASVGRDQRMQLAKIFEQLTSINPLAGAGVTSSNRVDDSVSVTSSWQFEDAD